LYVGPVSNHTIAVHVDDRLGRTSCDSLRHGLPASHCRYDVDSRRAAKVQHLKIAATQLTVNNSPIQSSSTKTISRDCLCATTNMAFNEKSEISLRIVLQFPPIHGRRNVLLCYWRVPYVTAASSIPRHCSTLFRFTNLDPLLFLAFFVF
jgi:hypothetical protein